MWRPMARGATPGVTSRKEESHEECLLLETHIVLVGQTLDLRGDYLNSMEYSNGIGRGLSGWDLRWFSCSQVVESLIELARVRFNLG